jgi:hypothetical protein
MKPVVAIDIDGTLGDSIRKAAGLPHAISMVLPSEAVIAYKLREQDRRA